MPRQDAKDFLLKVENPDGSGDFQTLGMLTSKDYTITPGTEDVTNSDSGDWEERDVTRLSFAANGRGFFDAGAALDRLRQAVRNRETPRLQVIDPGEGTWEGPFVVTYGKSGRHEGSVEYNVSLQNAGALTFAAA